MAHVSISVVVVNITSLVRLNEGWELAHPVNSSRFSVPPSLVTIQGPDTGLLGDSLNFRCLVNNANPVPDVQWVVNGRQVRLFTTGIGLNFCFTFLAATCACRILFDFSQSLVLYSQIKEGVNTNRHPPSVPSLGWDVTSDLQLEVGAKDSRIAITCLAVSRGHFGDAMSERAEKELVVLSEWIILFQGPALQLDPLLVLKSPVHGVPSARGPGLG